MKSYSENITAGQPLRLTIPGRMLYIQRSQGGPVLDVEFMRNQAGSQVVERVGKGFKAMPAGGFEGITIRTSVSGVVDFVVTDGDIGIQFDEDSTTIGNDDGQAIPVRLPAGQRLAVDIAGGTVNLTATNVAINNADAAAIPIRQRAADVFAVAEKLCTNVVDFDPASIGTARLLLVSDNTLKRLRVRNGHATARVALGGAALTMANAVVVIEPGDVWVEDAAPGAAWYAISDTAATPVNVQGLK